MIAYHAVREAAAGKIICLGHVKSEDNFSDLMTKSVGGVIHRHLTNPLLFKSFIKV